MDESKGPLQQTLIGSRLRACAVEGVSRCGGGAGGVCRQALQQSCTLSGRERLSGCFLLLLLSRILLLPCLQSAGSLCAQHMLHPTKAEKAAEHFDTSKFVICMPKSHFHLATTENMACMGFSTSERLN